MKERIVVARGLDGLWGFRYGSVMVDGQSRPMVGTAKGFATKEEVLELIRKARTNFSFGNGEGGEAVIEIEESFLEV